MKVLLFAILMSLLGGCTNSILPGSANVVEIDCDGIWVKERVCIGAIKPRSFLAFAINPVTRSVSLEVGKDDRVWLTDVVLFKDCAIIDSENWECGAAEKIGMFAGNYRRHQEGLLGYDIRGVAGWRYWAVRVGFTDLAFLGMTRKSTQ